MPGPLALIGGGEFTAANDALDRRLLETSGAEEVLVVPTADAFEHPWRLVDQAEEWFAGLGAKASGLRLLTRTDALDPGIVEQLGAARFIYLAGDSQLHLRSVLKGTPALEALIAAWSAGAVIAGAGPSGSCLCDPMLDSRGGGVTLGLGVIRGLTFVHRAETLGADWLRRIRELSRGSTVVEASSGGAVVLEGGDWDVIGAVAVHGDLPLSPP